MSSPRTAPRSSTPPGRAAGASTPLDRTLTYRLHLLHKLTDLASQRSYPELIGLSMSDGRCLTTIGTFEPLSVKDLARQSNLNKAQASRGAQALVDQGLVRKSDQPADGRGVVLTLTDAGRRTWQAAMGMVEQRNRDIFACLDVPELAQLSQLLDRLIAHNRPDDNPEAKAGATPGPDRSAPKRAKKAPTTGKP